MGEHNHQIRVLPIRWRGQGVVSESAADGDSLSQARPIQVECGGAAPGCAIMRHMDSYEQVLEWAENHIKSLTQELVWEPGDSGYGGFWRAANPQAKGRIRARATAALDFLDRYTEPGSRWSENAQGVYMRGGENQSMESGARAIGDILEEWTRMVRSGQVQPRIAGSFDVRAVSSTDLLEQVRILVEDRSIVPTASIVLAGAALEVALRSSVEELGIAIEGRRSIAVYAEALRRAEVLNRQDMKDVTAMAGLRNDAAHGEDSLSRERAGMMEQQVNHFLTRLEQVVRQSIQAPIPTRTPNPA